MLSIYSGDQCLQHIDRHTGGLFGKIPGHLFQSGTTGLWTPAIQLMSLRESINLSTVGQKAFSIAAKDGKTQHNSSTFYQCVRERGLEWGWKEKIVTITGKGKENTEKEKKSPWEGIIKVAIFFFCRILLLPCIIKIEHAYNFTWWRGELRNKEEWKNLLWGWQAKTVIL